MPTPAERQALLFLAGIIVLGAGVRVVRAARSEAGDDAGSRTALARQLSAVDSARSERFDESRRGGTGRKATRQPRGESKARPPGARRAARSADSTTSTLPPTLGGASTSSVQVRGTVDLDVASASEIETLPRIGPALARRIVEDREQNGSFGSLDGFDRVRGVGPSLIALVRERVTFSGTARPSNAIVDNRLRSPPPRTKSSRRERQP